MEKLKLDLILKQFNIENDAKAYGNGHINDTYICGSSKYILQRINTSVFTDPDAVMRNIENITEHLRKKITANGGDPIRESLNIIKTVDGKNYYKYDDNNVFRVYNFVSGTKTVEDDRTYEDLYNAGVGFGKFQRMLDDFPAGKLSETIRDFHNTPIRLKHFENAVREDKVSRVSSVKDEINFVRNNSDISGIVVEKIADGTIPLRVAHNDTKINNILFDKNTGEAVCVIDLDTVMPGSALYDFGDALRIGGSTAAEDETDLSKVHFDSESFKQFAKGYLSQTKEIFTKTELELLPLSVRLMTFECGMRFLTDYLNGDVYFKIHRPDHNLDRARNQFKLCVELKEKEEELKEIINDILRD